MTGATSLVHAHVGYADWMGSLLRWALRHADERVAISSFVAETLVASGHDPNHTRVVLSGIDASRWDPGLPQLDARHQLDLPADAPVILTACRLFPSKGPVDLVRALPAVRRRHPNVQLLVAGQEMVPGFAAELSDLAASLGLADHVRLLGYRRDLSRLLAASDVFAMPSVGEPFGLVYAEAMAMERPVVALESGGAPEVVQAGVTGLLSPPGDLDALARNLVALLSDRDARARMGRAGRLRVETDLTAKRMARDMASTYRCMLGRTEVAVEGEPDGHVIST
jgi:glycosyltransferase involved in cell wall biosynthesis